MKILQVKNRKIKLNLFLAVFVLILTGLGYTFTDNAQDTTVHDGDTVTIKNTDGTEIKFRLLGIDAPELSQHYGKESKEYLKSLLKNKTITFKSEYKDNYGRTVGELYADNESVNRKMVADGYAWHYKQFSNSFILAQAERKAKENKIGLWKSKSPTPPWIYRQNKKR